jgi:hypothetical protein
MPRCLKLLAVAVLFLWPLYLILCLGKSCELCAVRRRIKQAKMSRLDTQQKG